MSAPPLWYGDTPVCGFRGAPQIHIAGAAAYAISRSHIARRKSSMHLNTFCWDCSLCFDFGAVLQRLCLLRCSLAEIALVARGCGTSLPGAQPARPRYRPLGPRASLSSASPAPTHPYFRSRSLPQIMVIPDQNAPIYASSGLSTAH
eukprot:3804650-Rhodomonas_salina.1